MRHCVRGEEIGRETRPSWGGCCTRIHILHSQVREGVLPQRMDLEARLGTTDETVLAAVRTMERHIEDPMPHDALSAVAGVSLRHLERAFRREMGQGIHGYYLDLRLAQARQLLNESSKSVLEVASATGFASASQFSRAFRRAFGCAPRDIVRAARS